MSRDSPLRILMLCDNSRSHADTVIEHLAAFRRYSTNRVEFFNPMGVPDSRHLDLEAFDVVVIHYSLVITADGYISPAVREMIRAYRGLKVQFLQDEYRWVDDITAMMRYLEIDLLFSIVPEREIDKVYAGRLPATEIVPTLAGYVPEKLVGFRRPAMHARPLDVGYRGRVLPYWNGELSQEKVWIARGFLARAGGTNLRHDIAWGENDRIYGAKWHAFLASCRATLGTESGTSITDFDGSVEAEVTDYLAERPGATFEQTSRAVLDGVDGNVMMNVVSPRLFEAAAIGTGMVLFPGEYGGIVEPWKHYVPLAKDFSNFDEVVDAIRDLGLIGEMADRTRHDVVGSGAYTLKRFIAEFDATVRPRATLRATGSKRSRLLRARIDRAQLTRTALGFDPKQSLVGAAQVVAATHVALRDPELRRLTGRYLADAQLRRRVPPSRVAADILRLGVLRSAQAGAEAQDFGVSVRVDPGGMVVFVSHRRGEPLLTDIGEFSLDSAPVVLWDHRRVSLLFHYSVPGLSIRDFSVGYYGVIGIHHFGTLGHLYKALPEETLAVLRALRLAPTTPPPEPSATPGRLQRWRTPHETTALRAPARALASVSAIAQSVPRIARRAAAAPPGSLRKVGRLAGAFAFDGELRRVFHVWKLTRRAKQIDAVALSSELLKFHLLRTAAAGKHPEVPGLDLTEDEHVIEYRSRAEPGIRVAVPSAGTKLLVWDHSAIAGGVADGGPAGSAVRLGTAGRHEFRVLQAVFGDPAETDSAPRLDAAPTE